MKKRTTTQQLQQTIKGNLLKLIKAQKYNKSTYQTEVISIDLFKDSLDFLCESLFADCIGWYYERNHEIGDYVIEAGRMTGESDFIFIAHLCVNDGVSREKVDKALRVIEEE